MNQLLGDGEYAKIGDLVELVNLAGNLTGMTGLVTKVEEEDHYIGGRWQPATFIHVLGIPNRHPARSVAIRSLIK